MITIRRYGNLAEAGFAQSLLVSVGIHAALADEFSFNNGVQYVPWGIRLQVPESEAQRAVGILDGRKEFAPLQEDFVPPAEPSLASRTADPDRLGLFGTFMMGGMWGLIVCAALALLTIFLGGSFRGNLGGWLFIFVLGGVVGLAVGAIYNKGRRDAGARD